MPVSVKRREGESGTALAYRFSKRVQRSGVLREARRRRFHQRKINKNKRTKSPSELGKFLGASKANTLVDLFLPR